MEQRTLDDFSNADMGGEESLRCPTCGESDFGSERGLRIHHAKVHDQPLSPSTAENPLTPVTGEWLHKKYWNEGKTTSEIAEIVNVVAKTVGEWMADFDIDRRDKYSARAEGNLGPLRDAEWLREQYWEQRRSTSDISEELGVSQKAVRDWMERHEIDQRTVSEIQTDGEIKKLEEAEWIREQYVERERSAPEIAEECNVHSGTVYRYLEKHGIERRSIIEARAGEANLELLRDEEWLRKRYFEEEQSAIDIAEECNTGSSTVYTWMERHEIERKNNSSARADGDVEPLQNEEWLREQYIKKDRSSLSIARELGVSHSTVRRNMKRHGVETRSIAEAMTHGDFEKLQDEDWLRNQHIRKELTATEISNKIGVSTGTVVTWLGNHGIELQTRENLYEFEHLDHIVRSQWERQIAELLMGLGVEYEYESLDIEYEDGRIYTPDFITQRYVIEVKGQVSRHGIRRAEAALSELDDREYVIIGSSDAVSLVPADRHYEWNNRHKISELFQ